jgi:hypothetical protein
MKKLLILVSVLLITGTALAGSFTGSWPGIGANKAAVDATACATTALTRTDQDHRCYEVASANRNNTNAYAAECRFVMNLTGNKTQWRIDGAYDANQVFVGSIWQTLPACTGFLCGSIGTVQWIGRSPAPLKNYYYFFNSGNTAQCEIVGSPNNARALFSGSY